MEGWTHFVGDIRLHQYALVFPGICTSALLEDCDERMPGGFGISKRT
jgi:hypothetical protein